MRIVGVASYGLYMNEIIKETETFIECSFSLQTNYNIK